MNVVELASGMGPTGNLIDVAAVVEMMKSSVGIGLQRTLEVLQMLAGMFALAIRRVGKPHGWRGVLASRPFIAHVCPQAAGLGLAVARSEQRNRCIVGMNLACRQNMLAQSLDQWREQIAGSAHPTGQCRTIQIDGKRVVFPTGAVNVPG